MTRIHQLVAVTVALVLAVGGVATAIAAALPAPRGTVGGHSVCWAAP